MTYSKFIVIFLFAVNFFVHDGYCVDRLHSDEQSKAKDVSKNYNHLIAKAASWAFRGIAPTKDERDASESAYKSLEKEKDKVAEWIYARLRDEQKGYPIQFYGYVLWRFGTHYICRLEPSVLRSEQERIRLNGVYILGMGSNFHKPVVDVAITVLRRDPSPKVKAGCINALSNLGAKSAVGTILPFIDSNNPGVRKAAIQFFWTFPMAEAFEPLKERLKREEQYDVGFWLSWVLSKYPLFSGISLLNHENPGIRCGVLEYFSGSEGAPEHFTTKEYKAILDRLPIETDPLCKYEIAGCLAVKKDPGCLGVLIDILKGEENPCLIYRRSNVKAAAHSMLANLTGLPFYVTDEDRTSAHQNGGDLYSSSTKRYEAWWRTNENRIRWDNKQYRFVVQEEVKSKGSIRSNTPADADNPRR
jgi:hypothetical protein